MRRTRFDRVAWLLVALMALFPSSLVAGNDAALAEAAKRRDGSAVVDLLERQVDVNARQADGATALHWAAYWNDRSIAEALIQASADLNAENDLGVTPLWLASAHDDAMLVRRLLGAGADPNIAHMSGETPLMAAARTGRVEAVLALLAHGADVDARETAHDQTALMWAAANRHADVVQVLVEAGADLQARSRVRLRKVYLPSRGASYRLSFEEHVARGDIEERRQGGFTPLLFAAQQGDVESAETLLAGGGDVNDTAPIGWSALVIAAFKNQTEVARLLLRAGADPNAAGAGFTALHAAVLRSDLELVKALLSTQADQDVRITQATGARRQSGDYGFSTDVIGATPFYLAARYGEVEIMRTLAAHGADLRFQMPDGTTPMMVAMQVDRVNSLDLENAGNGGLGRDRRGRQVYFRLSDTRSPDDVELEVAEMVELIVDGGGDLNASDASGNTPLHYAARNGLNRVVELLVDYGAAVTARNRARETPAEVAEAPRRNRGGDLFDGHIDTASLLRRLAEQ